jgi:hypothetical protein
MSKERSALDDIRRCWAQEPPGGGYYFRDPVLDHPEADVAPVTPAPQADDNPEDLI